MNLEQKQKECVTGSRGQTCKPASATEAPAARGPFQKYKRILAGNDATNENVKHKQTGGRRQRE